MQTHFFPAAARASRCIYCSLRSLRCSLGFAATFVGSGETIKRCSAISSCRSAARTSRTRQVRRRSRRNNVSVAPLTLLAPLAEAGAGEPLPSSLARRRRRVCSLARPGQRRASLAHHGGVRFPTLASGRSHEDLVRSASAAMIASRCSPYLSAFVGPRPCTLTSSPLVRGRASAMAISVASVNTQ